MTSRSRAFPELRARETRHRPKADDGRRSQAVRRTGTDALKVNQRTRTVVQRRLLGDPGVLNPSGCRKPVTVERRDIPVQAVGGSAGKTYIIRRWRAQQIVGRTNILHRQISSDNVSYVALTGSFYSLAAFSTGSQIPSG